MRSDELLEAHPPQKGKPLRFAEAVAVNISPQSHGTWVEVEGQAEWKFTVEAPGARNVNLGFSRFVLPKSASLELRAGGQLRVRPFTANDNEEHGELWTPVVAGEELELVLKVSQAERAKLQLQLTSVNRGFRDVSFAAGYRKIGNEAPLGDCHIDVVCSAGQSGVGPAIDAYREQIRSAGVFTLGGVDTCSGAAINNTRNDGTPYYLTADHCGVRTGNASSMVVFWNHENQSCRTPGTGANGENGDGPITDFNTGAIFRSTYANSDMTLVELDDPLDPDHEVFLAGWSRTGTPSMAVGIHFPSTSEKRISFDFDALRSTGDSSSTPNANGTHWMVIDWNHGSTEGGSSGSPLFDQNQRIVGQLTGGDAACGNDDADWYGKLVMGWTGGGTSATRLSDWLDPDGTGTLTLDGIGGSMTRVAIGDARVSEGDAGTTTMDFRVALSEDATERIDLSYSTQDGTATAGSDFVAATNVPLSFAVGQRSKMVSVTINGDEDPEENETFELVVALVGDPDVLLSTPRVQGTIENDDFIEPVVLGPGQVSGMVAEDVATTVAVQNTPTEFSLSNAPEGMEISDGGHIRWVPNEAGTYQVMVTATNESGSGVGTITFTIAANSLADAVDSEGGFELRSGGASPFVRRVSADSINGGDRVRSGVISHGNESWLEVEVEGPDYLGFWWKVSSETDYDFFRLMVADELRGEISGVTSWEYVVLAIPPGTHKVRWIYSKDQDTSEGLDRGMVDFIQLSSRNEPFLMEPAHARVLSGGPVSYQFPMFKPGAAFTPRLLGAGLSVNAAGEVVGTSLATGKRNFTLTAEQNGRTLEIPATVEVFDPEEAGAAADAESLVWDLRGFGTWIAQGAVSRDGSAAQERGVPDSGRGELCAWALGPGQVTFWWRASSEEDYDFLHFEVDDQRRQSISGLGGWSKVEQELSYGWHKLTWAYEKDDSVAEGGDTGYIDRVSFSGYTKWAMEQGVGQRMGVTLDHDGDGQNMLLEFATGGSATRWDSMVVSTLSAGALELSVTKPAEVEMLIYDAEVSGNLVDWNGDERTILQNDEVSFRVRDEVGTGDASRRFLRMTVHPRK